MISNASPLIFFSKTNKLDILKSVFPSISIPKEVFEEVVRRGRGSPDSILIQEHIQRGDIVVKTLSSEHQRKTFQLMKMYPALDRGEAETILLAIQEKENEALIDDAIGRRVAELQGILPIGTLRIVLLAYQKKILSGNEVSKIISMLIDAGLYLGADVLEEFYGLFREMEKKRKL